MSCEHLKRAYQGHDVSSEHKRGEQLREISTGPPSKRMRLPILLPRFQRSAGLPFHPVQLLFRTNGERDNIENTNARFSVFLRENLKLSRARLNHGPPLVRGMKERLNEWIENTKQIEDSCLTDEIFPAKTLWSSDRISYPILPELKFGAPNDAAELYQERMLFAPIHRSFAFSLSETTCFDLELIKRQLDQTRAVRFDCTLDLSSLFTFSRRKWYTPEGPSKDNILDQIILRKLRPSRFELRKIDSTNNILLDDLADFSDSSKVQSDTHRCSKLFPGQMREQHSLLIETDADIVWKLAIPDLEHREVKFDRIERPILQASRLEHTRVPLELIPLTPRNLSKLSSVQNLTEYCNAFSSRTWYKRPKAMMSRQKGKLVKFFSTVKKHKYAEFYTLQKLELEEDTFETIGKFRHVQGIEEDIQQVRQWKSRAHEEEIECDTSFLNDYFELIPTASHHPGSSAVLFPRDKEELDQTTSNHTGSVIQSEGTLSNLLQNVPFCPNEIQPVDTGDSEDFLSFGLLGDIDSFFSAGNQGQNNCAEHSRFPR